VGRALVAVELDVAEDPGGRLHGRDATSVGGAIDVRHREQRVEGRLHGNERNVVRPRVGADFVFPILTMHAEPRAGAPVGGERARERETENQETRRRVHGVVTPSPTPKPSARLQSASLTRSVYACAVKSSTPKKVRPAPIPAAT